MSAPALDDFRHEIKFMLPPLQHPALIQQIRLHPAGFQVAYPARQVNNVYFDTYTLQAFEENLLGVAARTKVRYRWYGPTPTPDAGTLEVKCKRNQMGWKYHYPISEAPYTPGDSWSVIRQKIRAHLPAEGKAWFDASPQAVMINRYQRHYFVTPDDAIRLTVDSRQEVYDQQWRPHPNITAKANLPSSIILELKFRPSHREQAVRILDHLPGRASRHSKYIIGVLNTAQL